MFKKNQKNKPETTATKDKSIVTQDDTTDVNKEDKLKIDLSTLSKDLIVKEEEKKEEPKLVFGNSENGKVKVEELVPVTNPGTKETTIYVNEEASKESENIGVTIDTKNDTLVIGEDGTVREKTPGYEVKDPKTNEVIASGEGNVTEGYVEVNPDEYIKQEDLDNMVEIKQTVYNSEGVLYNPGEYVTKEGYNRLLEYINKGILSYTAPTNPTIIETKEVNNEQEVSETSVPEVTEGKEETTVVEDTNSTDEGIVNPDGTYTIFGLTFETKADYEQWIIQGYEGYDLVDGIMMSTQAREEYSKTLSR